MTGDGKRFIVRADEKLSAFLEAQRAVCIHLLIEQCQPITAVIESVSLRTRAKAEWMCGTEAAIRVAVAVAADALGVFSHEFRELGFRHAVIRSL